MVIVLWLSSGQTFVVAFSRFRTTYWFVSSAAESTADLNGSAPSEPKPNA